MWKPKDDFKGARLADRACGGRVTDQIAMAERRMFRRFMIGLIVALAFLLILLATRLEAAPPTDQELSALRQWSQEISGAVVYTRNGRVKTVRIGESTANDLGPGEYARWSPDGKRLAVFDNGTVYVMNADGSERREVVRGAGEADGSPIEFHSNGEEIIYFKRGDGLFAAHLTSNATRKLNAPGQYSGEPCISADGTKMTARWDNDLYMIDLTTGTRRKYARGCSPNVSPSGQRVMNNVGNHREIQIRNWDGSGLSRVQATLRPDRQWDNHHWSNHEDYIATEGENRGNNIYIVNIRDGRSLRASWENGVSPDVFIPSVQTARTAPARTPAPTPSANSAAATAPLPVEGFRSETEWPGQHAGLVFFWTDANSANEILAVNGNPVRPCRLLPTGAARFGRHFDLELSGGAFHPEEVDDLLLQACRDSGELSLELIFTPTDPGVHSGHSLGRLLAFSQSTHERNFTLNQAGNQIELHLRTAREGRRGAASSVTLDELVPGRTLHVVVTYRDGELIYYRNGQPALRSDRIRGDFENWNAAALTVGNDRAGDRNWSGAMEGLAIYNRVLTADEVAVKFRMQGDKVKRPPAERFVIEGELIESSAVPDPASIHPYRRALVVNTYRVNDPGALKSKDGRIQVAQWAILDGHVVASSRAAVGQRYPLVIEPFEAHPQLDSERLVSDLEDLDVPMYYDVRPPRMDENRLAERNRR